MPYCKQCHITLKQELIDAFNKGLANIKESGEYDKIIRAGIQSIDKGKMEAARSLGMTYCRSMYRVVLPQAIKNMIPSIVNQFIITLKDTSILSVIGFPGSGKSTFLRCINRLEEITSGSIIVDGYDISD